MRGGLGKKINIGQKKGARDVVTKYDLASEKFLIDTIRKKFPGHSIYSEEKTHRTVGRYMWVIDPLDGTLNFSRGIPIFCVAICFLEENIPIYAAIYNPMAQELFFAKKNGGAFLNGKKIFVSKQRHLQSALGSVEQSPDVMTSRLQARLQAFVLRTKLWNAYISTAALSLAYVASGRFDLAIFSGASPWDYVAGSLMVKAAGGQISQLNGEKYDWSSRSIVAASPLLHRKIMRELK